MSEPTLPTPNSSAPSLPPITAQLASSATTSAVPPVVPGMPIPPQLNLDLANLPPDQIAAILRNIPDMFKGLGDTELKDVATTLSQLSALSAPPVGSSAVPPPTAASTVLPPAVSQAPSLYPPLDPGPSSHPRGPPNLGAPVGLPSAVGVAGGGEDEGDEMEGDSLSADGGSGAMGPDGMGGGRRGGRAATMSNDEWTRQRKDNHKEVERRRRGNINDGINELGRIVPNGTGEKAKGAILARAVQYIHHLKENEARNIEKWTLEKLLMDQAMGDLQAQLEEMRRGWEEERQARERAESELEVLRGVTGQVAPGAMPQANGAVKRKSPEGGAGEDEAKRQRTE